MKRVLLRINPNQMIWSGDVSIEQFVDYPRDNQYFYYKKKKRFVPINSMTLGEFNRRHGSGEGTIAIFAKAMKGSLVWCSYCNEYKRASKFKKLHPVAWCKHCTGMDR